MHIEILCHVDGVLIQWRQLDDVSIERNCVAIWICKHQLLLLAGCYFFSFVFWKTKIRERIFLCFCLFVCLNYSVSGVTCPVMKFDYDRRFRIKLFAPLLISFEQFAMQLATYLGSTLSSSSSSSSSSTSTSIIRQFKESSPTTESSVLYVEHIENRTLLTMQFDERWQRVALNSSLGIESIIDYEQYLLLLTTTSTTAATLSSTTSLSTTTTTTLIDSSANTTVSMNDKSNNNTTTIVIVAVVILLLVIVGIAIMLKLLIFPKYLKKSKLIYRIVL